jgi:DNA-binding response OmpR family regulator
MSARATASTSNVHRLQPLRVLLSGRDRRFVRVTSFLLSRRGYDVTQAIPAETVKAAERYRADVVLLETDDSRLTAARKVAALQALSTTPGVLIVVGGNDHERWDGLATIAKWTPLDELVAEIEAASLSRPSQLAEAEDRAL